MPSIYDAKFSPAYAGQSATVRDTTGAEVEGSPVTLDASGSAQLELPAGSYTAVTSNAALGLGTSTTALTLNLGDSLDADAPGAAETAYLIAEGVAGDTSGNNTDLDLVADDRYGDLPDWVTIVDGAAVLGASAGGCVASIIGQTDFDFTATTAPTDPGELGAAYSLKRNGSGFLSTNTGTTVGDGEDEVSLPNTIAVGNFVYNGTLLAQANAFATDEAEADILDGVVSHTVYVNITRLAPAPVALP